MLAHIWLEPFKNNKQQPLAGCIHFGPVSLTTSKLGSETKHRQWVYPLENLHVEPKFMVLFGSDDVPFQLGDF